MARWSKPEVRRLMVDAVTPVVRAAGFRYKKTPDAFVRKIEGGRQELVCSLADYNPEFSFFFSLSIRLDAVQEITNRFAETDPEDHSKTMTTLTQLEFFGLRSRQGQGIEFHVKSEATLAAMMRRFLPLVRERFLPFFDEYRDIAAVNRGLNPEGAERDFRMVGDWRAFDGTYHPSRAMAGVAVAHLAQDPRFAALVRAYRRQIPGLGGASRSQFDNLMRSQFDNLVNYLNSERRLSNG
jgi:hypothetical protein